MKNEIIRNVKSNEKTRIKIWKIEIKIKTVLEDMQIKHNIRVP